MLEQCKIHGVFHNMFKAESKVHDELIFDCPEEELSESAERLEALYGKLEALPPGAMQSKVSRRSNAKPSAEQLCAIDTRPPCGLRR